MHIYKGGVSGRGDEIRGSHLDWRLEIVEGQHGLWSVTQATAVAEREKKSGLIRSWGFAAAIFLFWFLLQLFSICSYGLVKGTSRVCHRFNPRSEMKTKDFISYGVVGMWEACWIRLSWFVLGFMFLRWSWIKDTETAWFFSDTASSIIFPSCEWTANAFWGFSFIGWSVNPCWTSYLMPDPMNDTCFLLCSLWLWMMPKSTEPGFTS